MSIRQQDDALAREIASSFAAIGDVKAVALAGSTVTGLDDEHSDLDFYVYSDREIDCSLRREIAEKNSTRFNIDNRFYETDDEWLLGESGKQLEIIYRSRAWIEGAIEDVWVRGRASVGYSTCLVHNVRNSRIYHDPESWLRRLRAKTDSPYPQTLRENIVRKNLAMLHGRLNGSFREQIRNAVSRGDDVGVNHRVAAFLASYFDVVFAVNEVLCPGEKNLIRYATDTCRRLPYGFEEEIGELIRCPNGEKAAHLENLLRDLRKIL